jgi:hypothetical protein
VSRETYLLVAWRWVPNTQQRVIKAAIDAVHILYYFQSDTVLFELNLDLSVRSFDSPSWFSGNFIRRKYRDSFRHLYRKAVDIERCNESGP